MLSQIEKKYDSFKFLALLLCSLRMKSRTGMLGSRTALLSKDKFSGRQAEMKWIARLAGRGMLVMRRTISWHVVSVHYGGMSLVASRTHHVCGGT